MHFEPIECQFGPTNMHSSILALYIKEGMYTYKFHSKKGCTWWSTVSRHMEEAS